MPVRDGHRDVHIRRGDPWASVPIAVDNERPRLISGQALGGIALDDDDGFRPSREPIGHAIRRRHRATKWQLHDDAHGGRLLPELRRGNSPSPTHLFEGLEDHGTADPAGLLAARREAATLDVEAMELTCRVRGPEVLRLARHGNNRTLEKMMRYRKAAVNATDRTGATAVIHAARCGHVDTLRLLLERGAADLLECRSDAGWTAVLEACRHGHVTCLQLLLRNGARVEHISASGSNGLMLACSSGHHAAVHTILCHAPHAESISASEAAAYSTFSRLAELANEVTKLAGAVTRQKKQWASIRTRAIDATAEATAATTRAAEAQLAERCARKLERAAYNAWQRRGVQGGSSGTANLFLKVVSGKEAREEEHRLLRMVLHSWRTFRLSCVAEQSAERAKIAAADRATAGAENDKWSKKVGKTLYLQLQQKKEALRKRWKETRPVIERHLALLQTGCDMLAAADMDGWCALHHAASQGFEKLVRALLTAGADPLAVTHSGMRPAALAAQGRCFELRNSLEKEAQKCAAYRGIELEELDRSQQAELEADAERGKLLPSLSGEGRRKILARRRKDAARRREQSGMVRRNTRRGASDRLQMGLSTEDSPSRLLVSKSKSTDKGSAETVVVQAKADPADVLAEDLIASVQQVAPPMLGRAAEGLRDSAASTSVAAMEELRHTKLSDVDRMETLEGGEAKGRVSERQRAQARWRTASRSVIDRRGDFAVTRPSGDDADTHAREVERSELRGLRHFPRSLRQWTNAVRLLESHGARVNAEGGAVQLVEHEQEPVGDEASEFERLLGLALAHDKETESGIKSIRRRFEGARHEFPLGWFIQELGLKLAADEHVAAHVLSVAHRDSPASPG